MGSTHNLVVNAGDFVSVPHMTPYVLTFNEVQTEFLDFYSPAGPEQIVLGTSTPAQTLGGSAGGVGRCASGAG
jgi:hypothetical protein